MLAYPNGHLLIRLVQSSGTVRKGLGLKFLGETRNSDEERRYIADVRIKGFTLRGMHVWTVRGGNGYGANCFCSLRSLIF